MTRVSFLEIFHDQRQRGNRAEVGFNVGNHRAVAGWEVASIDFQHTNNSPFSGTSTVPDRNFDHGTWASPDPTVPMFKTDTTLQAVYVEDGYQLTDRWLLLGGIRHDTARVARTNLVTSAAFERKLTGTALRGGVTWKLDANTNVYAQASSGKDPVTSLVTLNLANADFKLTSGRQVEVGVKQRLPNDMGDWTAAAYRIDKRDIITRVVVVVSSYALVVALLGTTIGLMRWRWHDGERRSPYTGWLRWHHLLGLGCAVFTLAWLTSGLLSMNPGEVFSDRSIPADQTRTWRGGSLDDPSVRRALAAPLPPEPDNARGSAVELEWWPDGDREARDAARGRPAEPGVRVEARYGPAAHRLWRRSADAAAWSAHEVGAAEIAGRVEQLAALSASAPAASIERLAADDLYHYGRFDPAPPIWRVHLADDAATWLHVDARSGELLARLDRSNRIQRWTYHGLHSWDFAVLLRHRPLWDLLMLPALGLGLLFSITSVAVGAQRLSAMRRQGRSRTDAPAHARVSQPTAS